MKHTLRYAYALLLLLLLSGCGTYPARDPVGQTLPRVAGVLLSGEDIMLPDALLGRATVLIVLYQASAQDDANYWALITIANMPEAQLFEVAAFTQFKHRIIRRRLTDRAQERLPESFHDKIIALWSQGNTLARFTGNPRDSHPRILLLDEQGTVLYFNDTGFDSQAMRDFLEAYGEHFRD